MSKHTPGPWTVSFPAILGDEITVCEMTGAASNEEAQADARLISAAPDIMAALHKIKAGPEASGIDGIDSAEEHLAWVMQVVEAAIAKAEGK